MNHDQARQAVTLALFNIERELGLREVLVSTLWDSVQAHLRMADYAAVLRKMRELGHVLVEDDTIELTEIGRLEAEKINGQGRRQGRGADEHLDTQGPVEPDARGSGTPRGPERSVDAPDCSGPAVPPTGSRDDWLMSAGHQGLADAVEAHGPLLPHFALVSCVAFRLTQAGSDALGFDTAQALRLLADRGLVAFLGTTIRLLDRGHRAVSVVLTARSV